MFADDNDNRDPPRSTKHEPGCEKKKKKLTKERAPFIRLVVGLFAILLIQVFDDGGHAAEGLYVFVGDPSQCVLWVVSLPRRGERKRRRRMVVSKEICNETM